MSGSRPDDPAGRPSAALAAVMMGQALERAQRAADEGEIPVGALVFRGAQPIAEGWNRTLQLSDPTAHAEILALRRAAAVLRNHRLPGTTLVCTLEPCVMCFGALLEARVSCLVFGATDSKRGAVNLWEEGRLKAFPATALQIMERVEEAACSRILVQYFRGLRTSSPEQ